MVWLKTRMTKSILAQSRRGLRRPLRIELLEDRFVPTTIIPTTFADGGLGSGSLRDAVLQFNADSGTEDDTIQLLAGTYTLTMKNAGGVHETAGITGDLNLTSTSHHWIIQGAGPSTIIDASQLEDRVFQIVNPATQVVFQDLVIQGGLAQENGGDGVHQGSTDALGGGILNNGGDLTLNNVVLQNNSAQGGDALGKTLPGYSARGAGIYSTGGALTLAGATIANNQAMGGRGGDSSATHYKARDGGSAAGAGLYATGGSLDISDSTLANNQVTGGRGGDGGCVQFSGSSCLSGLGGTGGTAQGGGLYVNSGSLTVASSAIASNHGTGGPAGSFGRYGGSQGQGLYNSSNTGNATVTGTALSGNSTTGYFTGTGGGIFNSGTLTVSSSTLSGNSVYGGLGGGIDNRGTLTVSDSTLSENSAVNAGGQGGGIYNDGTLTVSNSTLSGNSAPVGGAIYGFRGTLTISNSTLSNNSASFGGAIDNVDFNNVGALTVSNSTLSGNSGGGIYNVGTLTVSNSTLSGNSGGGIYNGGTLMVSNSTLSGNSAAYGGGIVTTSPLTLVMLTNVTLTANRATSYYGGGLDVALGSPVLHNTLIAGNFQGATGTTPDDVYGSLNSGGDYNLIGDGTGMTGLQNGVNGNLIGSASDPIDPQLGPLDANGGPTLTHALLPGSPAIDAGNNAYATDWDQRGPGYPRIVNGIIDIGAFEYQGDGSAPSASGEARGRPILTAMVFDLPPRADFTPIWSSATFPGQATIASVTRGVGQRWEELSVPSAIVVDPRLALVHEKAPGPMAVLWPDPGPLQWSGPNPDLFPQEAGLAR
jgi:hypothetical protein